MLKNVKIKTSINLEQIKFNMIKINMICIKMHMQKAYKENKNNKHFQVLNFIGFFKEFPLIS